MIQSIWHYRSFRVWLVRFFWSIFHIYFSTFLHFHILEFSIILTGCINVNLNMENMLFWYLNWVCILKITRSVKREAKLYWLQKNCCYSSCKHQLILDCKYEQSLFLIVAFFSATLQLWLSGVNFTNIFARLFCVNKMRSSF